MKEFLSKLLIPIWYVVLYALLAIDLAAYALDKIFNSRLRKPRVSPEEIEFLIASNLPSQANSTEIFTFLRVHNFSHEEKIYTVELSGNLPLGEWPLSEANRRLEPQKKLFKKEIVGWIQDVGKDLTYTRMIRMIFYLDEREKLVAVAVDLLGTGL